MQAPLSIREVPNHWLPDMTWWRTEESFGCMATWSQDRIRSWAPPFGKSEDSCKPPQLVRPQLCLVPSPGPECSTSRPSTRLSGVSQRHLADTPCIHTGEPDSRTSPHMQPRTPLGYHRLRWWMSPMSPPRHPGETEQKIRRWSICYPTFVLRSFPS